MARRGADVMARALGGHSARGCAATDPQAADGVTYAAKIDKGETRIDWSKAWEAVHDHCRGLSPFPGAWFEWPDAGGRIKVLRTTRGEGAGAPPGPFSTIGSRSPAATAPCVSSNYSAQDASR